MLEHLADRLEALAKRNADKLETETIDYLRGYYSGKRDAFNQVLDIIQDEFGIKKGDTE